MAEIINALGNISHWGDNFMRNLRHIGDQLTPYTLIRCAIIIGTYMFIRSFIVKFVEKRQAKELKKPVPSAKKDGKVKITPNMLRGAKGEIEIESEEEEEEGTANGVEWGKKARNRQRVLLKNVWEQRERLADDIEMEKDEELEDLLVDYEEGKDGW